MGITGADHAFGANLAAIVAALVASGVFLHRWWGIRAEDAHHLKVAAWAYLVIALGMLLTAIQRGYWQLYYLALERGWDDVVRVTVAHQNVAAWLLLIWACLGIRHVRFALERILGRLWWSLAVGVILTAYLAGILSGN